MTTQNTSSAVMQQRDVVTIGTATLYCGDAYEIRPTLGHMDVDIMDPPYKFNNSGGGAFRKARGASDQIVEERLDRGFDCSIIDPSLCGSVIVFCHNDQIAELVPGVAEPEDGQMDAFLMADMLALLKPKFHRAVVLFWEKENPSPHRNKNYLADTEPYIHAWHSGFHPVGDHHDMHRFVRAPSVPGKRLWGHPTVKPDRVMDKILRNANGIRICDPFMGTGSTGVAAIRAGRRFYGIEKNPKHFATAVRRISEAWEALEVDAA